MSTLNLTPAPATILQRTLGMPSEGPKCIPITLDFSLAQTYAIDYSNMQQRGFLSMCQSVWVDNSLNAAVLSLIVPGTNQTIKVAAGVQDYFTVLAPNPLKLSFDSTGGVIVQVILCNFPIVPQGR